MAPLSVFGAEGVINHCAQDGDFEAYNSGRVVAYAWFIWGKGYKGEPVIRWFNE